MADSKTKPRPLPSLRSFISRFAPLLAPHKKIVAGSFAALFAEVLFRLLEPWPLKFVIDHIIIPTADVAVAGTPFADFAPLTVVSLAAVAVLLIAAMRAFAAYYSTVGFAIVGNRVLIEVRNLLYNHVHTLSVRFHGLARDGDLITRVVGDVGMLKEVAVTAFLPLMGNLTVLAGMLLVMTWLNWQLTLILVLVSPLLLWVTSHKQKRIREVARQQRKRESALVATAAESIGAIKTVQALSLGDRFSAAFSSTGAQDLREGVKGKRLAAGLERTVDVVLALVTGVVLWLGTWSIMHGRLTAGDMLVFLAYLRGVFKPVRNWAKYVARISKAAAAAERVLELMDREPEIADAPDARVMERPAGRIDFEQVSFAYDVNERVLTNFSLRIPAGKNLVVLGPSGVGKSTLLSLLIRLFDPDNGRVLVDGQDLRQVTIASWREQISIVLQDTQLFAGTIGENILYGALEERSQEDVEAAARIASIHEFVCSLPLGYDTAVGERGVTVSAGQRQRIAIARAAIRDAPILILDEPLVGLDADTARGVGTALQRLATGRTTVHVTHVFDEGERVDLVVYLDRGGVCEMGTHRELLAREGRYAAVFARATTEREALQGVGHVVPV